MLRGVAAFNGGIAWSLDISLSLVWLQADAVELEGKTGPSEG
jgi:hypothetical protein